MKLFIILFLSLTMFFLMLDFLAMRSKARLAEKEGMKPRATSVMSGLIVAFLLSVVISIVASY